MAGVDTCFISSGCNRTPNCCDWGRNRLICFGTCNAVALCRPEDFSTSQPGAILRTFSGHRGKVNCVQWVKHSDEGEENELVSGSVDKSVIVWERMQDQLKVKQILTGHTSPVTALETCCVTSLDSQTGNKAIRHVLVTSSADSTVRVWRRNGEEEYKDCQVLTYGSGFVLDMSLIVVPNTECMMLACACDDMKVHVYVEKTENGESLQFQQVIALPGHEDWVRAVDFSIDGIQFNSLPQEKISDWYKFKEVIDSGDILLASAAQDFLIRVWRFSYRQEDTGVRTDSIKDLPADKDIQMTETTLSFNYNDRLVVYAVSLETVLSGHENWIYSVKWKPKLKTEGGFHQEMSLLSVSMDKTMILWGLDTESGLWMEQVRVGEVGGNTLGLYGGMFSPDGCSILAHGYQGAFHHWSYDKCKDKWSPVVTVSGHFDSVEGIEWDKKGGNFLLSSSLDETVRLYAPWVQNGRMTSWYEVARPQVHGYSFQCIAMINRYQYASGADEKVIRVFDATDNFIENLCQLCGLDLSVEQKSEEARKRPVGASVPALGLSNKAIFTEGAVDMTEDLEIKPGENEQYSDNVFTQVTLKAPPTEEHLLQNTLWPEVQKLYGHGYEIFSLACDPEGTVLASSCKASKVEFASVILWDTQTWQQLCTLEGPSLTVTQIMFSNTGEYLLVVSRDRTWYLYRRKTASDTGPLYYRVANTDKKTCVHARIIWSCCWTKDDQYFLTASRDKKVLVWPCPPQTDIKPISKLDVPDSATAVHCTCLADKSHLVSVGLDSGQILLYKWSQEHPDIWQKLIELDNNTAHHATVKQLKFRPVFGRAGYHGDEEKNWIQLASCSSDHSVKIFNFDLRTLSTSVK